MTNYWLVKKEKSKESYCLLQKSSFPYSVYIREGEFGKLGKSSRMRRNFLRNTDEVINEIIAQKIAEDYILVDEKEFLIIGIHFEAKDIAYKTDNLEILLQDEIDEISFYLYDRGLLNGMGSLGNNKEQYAMFFQLTFLQEVAILYILQRLNLFWESLNTPVEMLFETNVSDKKRVAIFCKQIAP
ncbi:MAG: hypothetical protein R2798_11455 [Chitinophagales bacterium]|nr:hypothetical protein [Bacteroidota bacterium]MCB9043176.1 hypothetical protein [Chitinophagales bacterium]